MLNDTIYRPHYNSSYQLIPLTPLKNLKLNMKSSTKHFIFILTFFLLACSTPPKENPAEKLSTNPSLETLNELFNDSQSPYLGNEKGSIKIVYFYDYRCGHCTYQNETNVKAIAINPKIKIIYKSLPILGEASHLAAKASLAAHRQGAFKAYHEGLYQIESWTPENFKKLAEQLHLNVQKWEEDMKGSSVAESLKHNFDLATQLHIRGTPYIAIAPDKIYPGRFDSLTDFAEKSLE